MISKCDMYGKTFFEMEFKCDALARNEPGVVLIEKLELGTLRICFINGSER